MSKTLWLQPGDLNPQVLQVEPWDEVVHVFDPDWLAKRPHSLKQIHFICEALASLPTPVTVYRGNPLKVFSTDREALSRLFVVEPRDIELSGHLAQQPSSVTINWLPNSVWLRDPDQTFKRFFKDWNAVKKKI